MKKWSKIVLTAFSSLGFLSVAFLAFSYYAGAKGYLYPTQRSLDQIKVFFGIAGVGLVLLVAMIVLLFQNKKYLGRICTVLLIVWIPLSMLISHFEVLWLVVLGPNGCSYTEDIANYGKYDFEYTLPHFPKQITEEMTVVNFTYFYKDIDRSQTDICLEVKFHDRETMERYLTESKAAFSEKGVVEYQNPYNKNYTDVIGWRYRAYRDEWFLEHSHTRFDGDEDYRYVEIFYSAISYSYEELTVIFTYTDIGNDVMIGTDPDQGEYYPKILKRFGVEWGEKNHFHSADLLEPLEAGA